MRKITLRLVFGLLFLAFAAIPALGDGPVPPPPLCPPNCICS